MLINHVLVLARDVAAMRDFFVDVLGLEDGARPPFPFPGHWLYSQGLPLIHLASAHAGAAQADYLGAAAAGSSGPIDHVSLTGAALSATAERARQRGFATALRQVPLSGERQLFVHGPEGLKIELLEPITQPAEFQGA